MKLRVTVKDFAFFVAFCLLLFYLCCLATGNINLLSNGEPLTLSPVRAIKEFLPITILLFVILLVVIFSSVSSFIFERRKGIGLEVGERDNKGYSRWSKDKEIKSDKGVQVVEPTALESPYAGIPLVNDGKKLWVDNGEYHNLVIGATGSGKSQTCVEPMVEILIKKGESMIITDPKGELYRAASDYMRKRGYNVIVLNFRDPQNGNAWNPLTLPYQYYKEGNSDKATELLDDVALNILYDPNNKGEPFWEKSAADYFSGLTLGLFQDADVKEINLNSINYMSTVGEEKFQQSNYIKEYFKLKGEASNAYVFASNTINSPTETKGGILSVFRQKIRLFASRENLSEMLAYSDFDMRSIGQQKTAVFICIHDEKTTYHSLATIFIKQCYETLIDVAQKNGGKLPYRTNFILDEFANMPPLKDVTTMVTAARSRDIRFTFIIQNFAQLKSVYGNEDAETIKGNCGNLIYLISTELAALEEISKMCGEVKSAEKDKTSSTPLVTVTDLQKLKLFEAIIIRWRLSPFKTKYTPNYKMNWGHEHSTAEFPIREKQEVKLFDVQSFVKAEFDKKRAETMEKNGGLDPKFNTNFGGGFGAYPGSSNMFGGSNMFGSSGDDAFGSNLDLDAMMADIDRKIAELDAEEERKKKEEADLKAKDAEQKAGIENLEKSIEEKINAMNLADIQEKLDVVDQKIEDVHDEVNLVDKKIEDVSSKVSDETSTPIGLQFESNISEDAEYNKFKQQLNLYDDFGKEKSTATLDDRQIAVATGTPVSDESFVFDELPEVMNADVLQANYASGSVVKTDQNDFNIYSSIPSDVQLVNNIKEVPEVLDESVDKVNVNVDPDKVDVKVPVTNDEFFDDFFGDE